MAARKVKKQTVKEILAGVTITIVARKEGEAEKAKDMIYGEALEAAKLFKARGWTVSLYKLGFYQPFEKSKNK